MDEPISPALDKAAIINKTVDYILNPTDRKVMAVLAVLAVIMFAVCLFLLILKPIALTDTQAQIVNVMVGMLGTVNIAVYNYYFGSSIGSHNKDVRAALQRQEDKE
jgi:membrane protein YdbS with pleckstrin-like domain